MELHHYTDKRGYDRIRATVVWCFRAGQPVPRDHPFGAYFTTMPPGTKNLALRIRVPNNKITHLFSFLDAGDLTPIRGGRGEYVFYSPKDYLVVEERQTFVGERGETA
jgi:hypothetical protein